MSGGLKHVYEGSIAPMGLQLDVTRDPGVADLTQYTAVAIECLCPNGETRRFPAVVALPPSGLALTATTISVLRLFDGTEWRGCGYGDAIAVAVVSLPSAGEARGDPVHFEIRNKFGQT